MKILKKLKNKYFRGGMVIIVCYLIASIGVNKVANPMHYFAEYSERPISFYEENSRLYIDISELTNTDHFINIYVEGLQNFGTMTYLYSDTNDKERVGILLCNGNNSVQKSKFPSNEGSIYIRLNDIEDKEFRISQISASANRYVYIFPMLKVFICSIMLVAFWRFMNNLKEKYAS